ncbi:Golgi-resident PAp (PAP) 3-Phosphatase-like protein [Aphelenchoides fujianensis]|nr:Golgi-resident PAp (PAP) 3-Phosphatase-like protein [Aphelenchoides fujianensis]
MPIRLNFKNLFFVSMFLCFVYLAFLLISSNNGNPDFEVDLVDVIGYAVMAAEMGGDAVVKVYSENNLKIKEKGLTDEGKAELLTKADLVSNHLIMGLLKRFPLINVVTEEKSEQLDDAEVERYRKDNYSLWLSVRNALKKMPSVKYDLNRLGIWVDPLDATQEFTEGLLDYVTVMTCITLDNKPIFGAIYRPFYNESVFGLVDFGLLDSEGNRLSVPEQKDTQPTIVVSPELAPKAFGSEYKVEPAGGSGYKTLRVLNGTAALYVHTTAIKKWDVCAADALMRAAGGSLIDLDGQPLDYAHDGEVLNKNGLLVAVHNPFGMLSKRCWTNSASTLSKTKSIVGFSNVSAGVIDNRELEESVRIEFDDVGENFVLHESEESGKRAYAPFGLLEPPDREEGPRVACRTRCSSSANSPLLQKKLRDLHH